MGPSPTGNSSARPVARGAALHASQRSGMSRPFTKGSLSAPRRRLLELMQRIYFGRLEGLSVHAGEPAFDPPPRVTREHKFGGDNAPHPDLNSPHAALNAQQVEL